MTGQTGQDRIMSEGDDKIGHEVILESLVLQKA